MKRALCILICLMLSCSVCAGESSFAPGEPHTHTLDFRQWFETMSAQTDACTLSIHEDLYDEASAEALLDQVSKDVQAIIDLTGAQLQPHTVYVAKKLFNGVQRFENRVYCRAEDIESGAYLEYLIAAALGLEERWKAVGLEECLQGDLEDVGLGLRLYFSWSADMELLSLFHAYFVDEFASSHEQGMARQTAGLLCRYILDHHGYDALAGDVDDGMRTEWLQSIGVDRTYADPYGGVLDGFSWETSAKYPLILRTEKGDLFYLTSLEDDMETPLQVRAFLYEAIMGPQKVIDGLRADAPEYAEYMQKNFASPLKYYIEPDSEQYSYADWAAQEIHIGFTSSIIHETMHILTRVYAEAVGYYMDQWKVEGIADYLTLKYWPSAGHKEALYWELIEFSTEPEEGDTERDAAVKQAVLMNRELYLANNSLPESAEEINAYEYVLASAKAYQMIDWDWKSVGDAFNSLNSKNVSQRYVNGLTYNEVFSFTDYLIRTYSLDQFLDFCMGDDFFEEAYNLSYEEAMEGWRTDLLREE